MSFFKPKFKSATVLSEQLFLIFENPETRRLYLNNYSETGPEQLRCLFTFFIFILFISLMAGQRCRNPESARVLAEIQKQMLKWWGENALIQCFDYTGSIQERAKINEIWVNGGNPMTPSILPGDTRLPFNALVGASLLARMEIYSEDLTNLSKSNPDLDGLFMGWAMKSQQFIAGDRLPPFIPASEFNLPQETLRVLCLKAAISEYYSATFEVFRNQ